MEVISSDWIYIAANGRSGAVGKRTWRGARAVSELAKEEKQHVYSRSHRREDTRTQHRASHDLHLLTSSGIYVAAR